MIQLSRPLNGYVVTDLEMPGMSGLEMCAALRDRVRPPASIVLTASKTAETEAAALRCGAFACVAKPIRVDVLETAIRQALECGVSLGA